MAALSPLTRAGIRFTLFPWAHPWQGMEPEKPKAKTRRRIEEVVLYRCPECQETHDDRGDAEDCCAEGDCGGEDSAACPVCASECADTYTAADCCLWRDMAAPERWRIADAVEAGATWAEALGVQQP